MVLLGEFVALRSLVLLKLSQGVHSAPMRAWLREHALPVVEWLLREGSHFAAHLAGEVLRPPTSKPSPPRCAAPEELDAFREKLVAALLEGDIYHKQVLLAVGFVCFLVGCLTGCLASRGSSQFDGARGSPRRRGAGVLVKGTAR